MSRIPVVLKNRQVDDISTTEVASRLIHMCKPKSSVSIDPQSRLIPIPRRPINNDNKRCPSWGWLAKVMAYRRSYRDPESLMANDIRGNAEYLLHKPFLKAMRDVLVGSAVPPEPHQFGGLKSIGADHLLSELVTEMIGCSRSFEGV